MYGAIIGDLAGSIYEYKEFNDTKKGIIDLDRRMSVYDKPILATESFYSDDTILTIALLDALLNQFSIEETYKAYFFKYKEMKLTNEPYFSYPFSPGFVKWCWGEQLGNSIGNGAAMRISPVGYLSNSLEEVKKLSYLATIPSHNSKEAIKGAEAIAMVIYLSRLGNLKDDIKKYMIAKYYPLNYDLSYLQRNNTFNGTCEVTVPQAIYLALTANSFEGAIRNSLSIGGDTDTIACITGAMAEALYGIPDYLITRANQHMPAEFQKMIKKSFANRTVNK